MGKKSFAGILIDVAILAGVINGQGPLEIRAAASTAVTGWQQMVSPSGDQVWVSPTNSLTSTDVERAEARTLPNGGPAVAILLTPAGAKRWSRCSADHTTSHSLLCSLASRSGPVVRGTIEKEAVLTGGPGGLAPEESNAAGGFNGR